MSSFVIEGGVPLQGEVQASGNKNAALPMIAAALLTDEEVVLENIPDIRDVHAMLKVIESLGAAVSLEGSVLTICAANLRTHEIPASLCSRLRTSFLCVAPLLNRLGRAKVHPPGGDVIGRRRLDAHFYGLRALGAEVNEHELEFVAPARLKGRDMFFDEASVTATEHIMMAAVMADGESVVRNAASEPHVQDLAQLLIAMGAQIEGLRTNTLAITGVERLHGARHRVQSDHTEVGSYLALAAATGGEITVHDTSRGHYWMIHRVFERFGLQLDFTRTSVHLPGDQEPQIAKDAGGMIPRIDDGPWPQFPSDLMSSMIVLATQSEGTVLFFEKMFESRMYFVDSLIQMGASIIVCDPHRVVVSGRTPLRPGVVRSPDIRAGMGLISAALCAHGRSTVQNAQIIDRGYAGIEHKLQALGAQIDRVE